MRLHCRRQVAKTGFNLEQHLRGVRLGGQHCGSCGQFKQALVQQREVGIHTHSFARALRSAMREDPDVIVIGELRDKETIELALTAAETGRLPQ